MNQIDEINLSIFQNLIEDLKLNFADESIIDFLIDEINDYTSKFDTMFVKTYEELSELEKQQRKTVLLTTLKQFFN